MNNEKIVTEMVKDFFKSATGKYPKYRWWFNIYCGDTVGVCRDGHIIYYIHSDLFPLDINKYKFVSGGQTDLIKDMYVKNHDIYDCGLKAVINTNLHKTILADRHKEVDITIFEFLDDSMKMAINSEFLSMFDIDNCLFRAKNNMSALYVYSGDGVLLGAVLPVNPNCLYE